MPGGTRKINIVVHTNECPKEKKARAFDKISLIVCAFVEGASICAMNKRIMHGSD